MAKTSPAIVNVKPLHQIGFVVNDLEKTMRDYWNILGIGPYIITSVKPGPDVVLTYNGKPASYKFKAGFAQVGPVELELIQSTEGHSSYDDFGTEHGEGIHHLGWQRLSSPEAVATTVKSMEKAGFPCLMSGRSADSSFAYIDTTRVMKTILELFWVNRWVTQRLNEKSISLPWTADTADTVSTKEDRNWNSNEERRWR